MDCQKQAQTLLANEPETTCVAVWEDGRVYRSTRRGIAPLLLPMQEDIAFFSGAAVADRVIGKSAALLLVYSGARSVYGRVMSDLAAEVLAQHGLPSACGERTEYIVNRTGDGMCPMEQSVLAIDDPEKAYAALCETYRRLNAPQTGKTE